LSATELLNLKNQIEKVDAFIKLIKYELDDCRKSETTIINEIKQVKESLNEKRKINSKSQNLEEIKKLENKMESLFKKQSNTCKKVVATEKRLKIKEDARKKLVLGLERLERRASFIVQSPKAKLKTKNIQCGKKSISYQCPVNTSSHHKKCFSPKELTQKNNSLKDLSHKESKDNGINQENTPPKHPFNKNSRKTIIDSNADVTPIKQSNARNSLNTQKSNSFLISKPETNLNNKKNIKNPLKADPKTVKSLLPRPFNSNTSTPKRTNMHTTQIKPKTYVKHKPNVLPNTNSTAFKNIDDLIPKIDNSQIENESNDYEKFNGNINKFKDNNVIQEVHLSEEDILPLVCDLTEKSIMKDGEIELARDSTLDEYFNLIESTSQENVSKESNLLLVLEQTEKLIMKDVDIKSVRDSTSDESFNLITSTLQGNVSKESNSLLESEITEKSMTKDVEIELARKNTLDASDNFIESTPQKNFAKESNLPLVSELTENLIMKDGETELARDDTLEESYNLIEFTSQENVTETEYSKNKNINVGELKNGYVLDELNKSEENDQSKDLNDKNDYKKSGIPVFIQRKTLKNEKQSTCHQVLKTKIIHDFSISDKTLLVDDLKDIHPTTLDINNGNKKLNENKEQDIMTKIQHAHDESSINPCISDDEKNTKDMNNLKALSSEHDISPVKLVLDFNNMYSEPPYIFELKNVAILNSEPSESCNTEIKNEKLIDNEALDSNKETQRKSSNHEFKIICLIITLGVVGIVVVCFIIFKHKLLSLFFF
jgi:hypothetical protein